MDNKKITTARLSIFSNTFLILMKVIVGFVSASVSIISEAIHSGIDLFASVIAYFSLRISDKPADKKHPYGHGKFENVSGVVEAILIFIAAIWIIYEAVKRLMEGESEIKSYALAVIIMFVSASVNFIVSRLLYKTAKQTDSIALEADALHLKTDVYTSLGVGVGLFVIWLTKINILDSIIAIMVALLIIKEAFDLLKRAYSPLVDASLSDKEMQIIKDILSEYSFSYHDLKTRKSGSYRFADIHIELPGNMELKSVHDICDEIEEKITHKLDHIQINIHVEPV